MNRRLASIQRHPIKSHGRETLSSVALTEGGTLPWDRCWAVAHEAAMLPGGPDAWAACVNFSRGAKAPALMAIEARLDEVARAVTLTHPDRPPITFRPDDLADTARFIAWVTPLVPADRAPPARIVAPHGRGMTDTDYPSVSILNLASHADLGRAMGTDLSPLRWRCNFWLEGVEAWTETGWTGRRLRIGGAVLEVTGPITRCKATSANPATGRIDADTLSGLAALTGAQDCGVYARVVISGRVAQGDSVELL